jgi:SAM-dependent methyltransferase
MGGDRDEAIRERMRRDWGGRSRFYADHAAPRNRPFAEILVGLVRPAPGERVLDVATGSGVVAIEAARAVGPGGSVVATDLAPAWGPILAERTAAAGVDNVEFRVMGAEALALPDGSFDVALCQFGLMFVPDPVGALREMRRVLRPGGRLGVAVWSTPDKVAHFLVTRIVMAAAPPLSPEERGPSPLELCAPGLIEGHVAAAGFREVAVERQTREHVVPDPEEEWRRRLGEPASPVPGALAAMSPAERDRVHEEVVFALESFRRDGEIRLPSEAIFVTAVR